MVSYEYPRIDSSTKAYFVRLAQHEDIRELVTEFLVPRLSGKAFSSKKIRFCG